MTRTVVAGGPEHFMTVHHLTIRGSQVDIGRALAEEAKAHFGLAPTPADPILNRARRVWFERNWPQHHARMRGVADALGVDLRRDDLSVGDLEAIPSGLGCSATWTPPSTTTDGRGRLGRNCDFFTGPASQLFGGVPSEGEPSISSRPYVITTIPDDGLASTSIAMTGLDGCMDGVNERGLAVALLMADIETVDPTQLEGGYRVGLHELHVPRFLLDTCETVDQAKVALLSAKQYDAAAPAHYIVADASGRGFVWERGTGGREHVVEVADGPLCVTNHLLHQHPDPDDLPEDSDGSYLTYQRVRTLTKRTRGVRTSADGLRDALDEVQPLWDPAWRTVWRTVFDVDDRTMTTRFFLGDNPEGEPTFSGETVFSGARV